MLIVNAFLKLMLICNRVILRGSVMTIYALLVFVLSFLCANPLYASSVEVGFSPGGTAQRLILKSLAEAKESIDVATYSFTSKPVADELTQASVRGVKIRVLADKKESQHYTRIRYLSEQGISVRVSDNYQSMHNKFMVIDNDAVQTGSYNYSASANDKNAENVIVLSGDERSTRKFSEEFNRLWQESTPLPE